MSDTNSKQGPIPRPWHLRWQDLRVRFIPALMFILAWAGVALIWKDYGKVPSVVGQAEPVVANVSSYKPGVLTELSVTRFQHVKAGDPIGLVTITQPQILAAALAQHQAEIVKLQAEMRPVLAQQRTAMDYDQLQLEWMRQREALAGAQVNLQLKESEFKRMDALFKDQIVSQRAFEEARAARDRLTNEVSELSRLVSEAGTNFLRLQATNTPDITKVSLDPLKAAIAAEEAKLRLTEAELSPVPLKAPIDGIISTVMVRAGEAVIPGQSIVAVTTLGPVRIVAYLRTPVLADPRPGMEVEVLTRGVHRHVGKAKVLEVGTQYENVPATLLGPVKFADVVQGLPLNISLPPSLALRAGEIVDISLFAN